MMNADSEVAGPHDRVTDPLPLAVPDALYPDPARPPHLATDICTFLARQRVVQRIVMFGSQARGTWDRWSDLDLLLVTWGNEDYREVLAALRAAKPIIYHAPVRHSTDHPGRKVVGIVFEDESVFHSLDLNFMPLAVYRQAGARAWFDRGLTLDRYVAPEPAAPAPIPATSRPEPDPDPQEQALEAANWWLKRALRHTLRTGQDHDELAKRVQAGQAAMQDLPDRCALPNGDPCRLTHIYLALAGRLLSRDQRATSGGP